MLWDGLLWNGRCTRRRGLLWPWQWRRSGPRRTRLLVGQPQLVEHLRKHASLDQRIATRGFLRPLSREEVPEYVAHRLRTAGRDEPVFSPTALELVYEYSSGVPRQINNLCDIALVIGFSRKLEMVDEDAVRRLIQQRDAQGPHLHRNRYGRGDGAKRPLTSDALVPGEYFYDASWLNAASERFTPIKGNFLIEQDRGKA